MNEGLTIQLAVKGVQQAISEFGRLKGSIAEISEGTKTLTTAGTALAAVAALKSGWSMGSQFANARADLNALTREFQNSLGIMDGFTNWWNREDRKAQESINIRKAELQTEVKIAELQDRIQEAQDQFMRKTIKARDLFKQVEVAQASIKESDMGALTVRQASIQSKLKNIDPVDLEGEKKRQPLELELAQVDAAISMASIRADAAERATLTAKVLTIQAEEMEGLKQRLSAEEGILRLKQDQFKIDRERIGSSFRIPDDHKQIMTKASLEAEKRMLADQILSLNKQIAETTKVAEVTVGGRTKSSLVVDEPKRAVLTEQLSKAQHESNKNELALASVNAMPDLRSFTDQFTLMMSELRKEIGTVAQQVAGVFGSTIQGAIAGISGSIQGLIQGTMRWRDALSNIGSTILSSVIQAISQMIAKLLIIKTLSLFIPGGGLLGRLFAAGGYTGDGPVNQIAGAVHKGEYVIPAYQVKQIGLPNIESLLSGIPATGSVAVQSPDKFMSGGGGSQNIAFFDDGTKLSDWAKTQEGETIIVDVVRRNMHRL